jgi:signal transduction histidine kinase
MKKFPHFKTNVLIKSILGKDLINDDNIAVLELVKNSYDAGAKTVDLYFKNLGASEPQDKPSSSVTVDLDKKTEGPNQIAEPEILVVDTGSGMSKKDLEEKWLNIAYSDKKYEQNKKKRLMAGNKGVGRLSCDRLGKKLDLFTRTHRGKLMYLSVNWLDFEKEHRPKLEIQDVPLSLKETNLTHFESVTRLPKLGNGTVLRITGLRSSWDKDSLLKLRRYLERLFNPNQAFEKDKFRLALIAPDFNVYDKTASKNEKVNGLVSNEIFERLNFKATNIESFIDNTGQFVTTVLRHEGKVVYRVVERNELTLLKDVRVVIYYLNPYKKAYFKKQTGLDSVEFGSIFLFLNGFRIPPYGDRGNDWLGLDVRKTQGMARFIATRDLVGRIEINDFDNTFIVVSNREGIVKGDTYEQLTRFYYTAHLRLETFVVDGLKWDSVPEHVKKQIRAQGGSLKWNQGKEEYNETEAQKTHRISEKLVSVLSSDPDSVVSVNINPDLLDQISAQHRDTVNRILSHFEKYDSNVIDAKLSSALTRVKKLVDRQDRQLRRFKDTLEEKESEIEGLRKDSANKESEILFLKSISTLDEENLLNFVHQIGLDSLTVKNTVERLLSRIATKGAIERDSLATALEGINFANRKILALSQFATKANFKFASQTIEADLVAFVQQYLLNISKDFSGANLNIAVEGQDAGPFEIKLKPIEVSIVLDNLLSNARKAGAKEIRVKMTRLDSNRLEIVFRDYGNGLSPQITNPANIFRKGFSTTSGSGLGLFHVAQILGAMKGSITAAPSDGKGVAFTIQVKK